MIRSRSDTGMASERQSRKVFSFFDKFIFCKKDGEEFFFLRRLRVLTKGAQIVILRKLFCSAFSFGEKGAKEKAWQKEKRRSKEFRTLRSARRAPRPPLRRLLRKEHAQARGRKLFTRFVRTWRAKLFARGAQTRCVAAKKQALPLGSACFFSYFAGVRSITSIGSRRVHMPPVKSGIACGNPPAAIDASESAVMHIQDAAS